MIPIEFRDLRLELCLSTIARVPHTNHRHRIRDAMGCSGSIVADGNDARRLQQDNKLLEQFFAGSPFVCVVLTVGERIS